MRYAMAAVLACLSCAVVVAESPDAAPEANTGAESGRPTGAPAPPRDAANATQVESAQERSNLTDVEDDADAKGKMPTSVEGVLQKLHKINKKEIGMGKMAMEKGSSEAVKRYGETLVNDHKKADELVMAQAKARNIELKQGDYKKGDQTHVDHADGDAKAEVPEGTGATAPRQGEVSETGGKDVQVKKDGEDHAHDDPKHAHKGEDGRDHRAEMEALHNASGAEFDRKFAAAMLKGHEKAIKFVDAVKADANLAEVHALVTQIRPDLEKHRQTAQQLAAAPGA